MTKLWTPEKKRDLWTPDGTGIWIEIARPRAGGPDQVLRRFPCHSWLKQIVDILGSNFALQDRSTKNTDGAAVLVEHDGTTTLRVWSGNPLLVTYGLVLGTGSTAVTADDYGLEALITDGNGAGQFDHQITNVRLPSSISGGERITIDRQADNLSGGEITVNEMAVYVWCRTSGTDYVCILRDIVSPGEAIPDGESRVFKYHLDFTV